MNFKGLRCTSILVFATMESNWSGAIRAFWDDASIGTSNLATKSVGELMGRNFTLTLPLPRRCACPDVIQYRTSYLLRVWVTGMLLPRFFAPLLQTPDFEVRYFFFSHTSQQTFTAHVLPRVLPSRQVPSNSRPTHPIVDRTGYRGLEGTPSGSTPEAIGGSSS
jgi:hypothetical protein